jgi:hypothetical protein
VDIPASLLVHSVTIEPYTGTNSMGEPVYSTGVTVAAFVDDKRQLVRAATGEEVTSEATVIVARGAVCPVESRITLPSGRTARVIKAMDRDGGTLPVPSHLEILTT